MRFFAATLILVLGLWSPVLADERVHVCDDNVPWAPFTYPASTGQSLGEHGQTGAMVAFLDAIMTEANLGYVLDLKPWKRCLKELNTAYQPGLVEVVVNVSFNEERNQQFLYSKPIYHTRRGIFFAREQFPNGLAWEGPEDTRNYKVCGVRGYNYSDVMEPGGDIDVTSNSLEIALKQVEKGRCQILFNSVEPVMGSKLFGESIVPSGVTYVEYELGAPNTFHIMVSRKSPRGERLRDSIDRAIDTLVANGTRDEIFDRFRQMME